MPRYISENPILLFGQLLKGVEDCNLSGLRTWIPAGLEITTFMSICFHFNYLIQVTFRLLSNTVKWPGCSAGLKLKQKNTPSFPELCAEANLPNQETLY
jgi:hypothetical protein